MKSKITLFCSLVLLITLSFAFTPFNPTPEYFEGKWSVLIKGTPSGDATIPMRFETKDGKTTGYFMEEGVAEEKKMSSASISGDVINTSFNITGYDVTLTLKKVDSDHAKGDLMGMFDVEGTRVTKK
ncbi:cytochrome c [Algoriphagus ratkowskyi]|uniref:Cytochrome c n=1 Tax=Algoriphagus ratkowskyi TaxID=57028 RepID=A0A2W7R961_9BACT|nr:hypothetical protein [Algoriphagus ratkowskyi]PZX56964.1 cytochrome c [Algoriphagus ratkowskyi]TXD79873.1 hypothetical protein ESW18_01705 [Algoriphagus ratkowskyi]